MCHGQLASDRNCLAAFVHTAPRINLGRAVSFLRNQKAWINALQFDVFP